MENKMNKKNFRLSLAFILLFLGLRVFAWAPSTGEPPKPIKNYEYVTGEAINFQSLIGKPTVLYFGGDWCPPCRATRPSIVKLAGEYGDKVNFIFIGSDDNSLRAAKLQEIQGSKYKIAMPTLAKFPAGTIQRGPSNLGDFGRIYWWPTVVVLDSHGVVTEKIERTVGVQNLEQIILGLLK
jgi:thiol-disulfide isomerase/thioredoxin